MPQQGMLYACVCTVFIKSMPLCLTHVGYDQCKQYGFIMTKYCHLCSVIFLHQTGSEENNFNMNVKPDLCAAIVWCKSATKASLLCKIASWLKVAQIVAVASEEAAKWRSESLGYAQTYNLTFLYGLKSIRLQVTINNLTCIPISQSCTPYNSWQEHRDTTIHTENFDCFFGSQNNPSLCLCVVSRLAISDFLPQLITASPKVAGHATFSWSTYHKMEYQWKLAFTKCYLGFAEKHHRMSGSVVIIGVWKFEISNTLFRCVTEGISFEPGSMKLGLTWVKPGFQSHDRTSRHILLKCSRWC